MAKKQQKQMGHVVLSKIKTQNVHTAAMQPKPKAKVAPSKKANDNDGDDYC